MEIIGSCLSLKKEESSIQILFFLIRTNHIHITRIVILYMNIFMEIINGRIDKTLMSSRSGSKKIFKAGVGYTVGNYMLKGLTFFSIPLFTRLLTTSDYGQFNTFIAYESIVFVVIGLALHASFKNAKYKYKHNFNRYVSTCITLGLICGD